MKYLLAFLTCIALTAATRIEERGKWVIDYNSQLLIHGQTNINSFTCFISCYNSTDTLAYEQENGIFVFEGNKMTIPVFNFNCGNGMITKDFRTTVKADKNPYLTISFVTLEKHPADSKATAKLDITLAGVSKQSTLQFDMNKKGDFIQLSGKHPVCFSDFQLQAPERMLGMVKVKEDLRVEFNLLIRPL